MKSVRASLVGIVEVGNTLGEGVLWDDVGGRVWWTDNASNWPIPLTR